MDGDKKTKRVSLKFSEKRQIIEKMDNGGTDKEILEEYKIRKSTLYNIKKNRKVILETANLNKLNLENKKQRRPINTKLDKALYEWFSSKRKEGISISGPMLVTKAKSLLQDLNITIELKFSTGWLRSFKRRHGIRHLGISDEQQSAGLDSALECKQEFEKFEYDLTPDNIYHTDEMWGEENSFTVEETSNNSLTFNVADNMREQEISWADAEKSMQTVITFLQQNSCFGKDLVSQAYILQLGMLKKEVENRKPI